MRMIAIETTDEVADAYERAIEDPSLEVLFVCVPVSKAMRQDDHAQRNSIVNEATAIARQLLAKHFGEEH